MRFAKIAEGTVLAIFVIGDEGGWGDIVRLFSATAAAAVAWLAAGVATAASSPHVTPMTSTPDLQDLSWEIPGAGESNLYGLSCWAAGSCLAVGESASQFAVPATAELANGAWTSETLDAPGDSARADLLDVGCTTAESCVAIGAAYDTHNLRTGTFVEVGAPGAWSTSTIDPLVDGSVPSLDAISCPSTSSCFAVGSHPTATGLRAVVDHWDGNGWTAEALPVSTSQESTLLAVDCVAVDSCTAVGSSGDDPMVETLAGGAWTRSTPPMPNDALGARLTAVSCAGSADCASIGYYRNDNGDDLPFADTLAGGSWTSAAIPILQSGFEANDALSVSCAAAGSCVATGDTSVGAFAATLSAGTWSTAALPSVADTSHSSAGAIACSASDSCLVVGSASATTYYEAVSVTLANGTWSAAAVPMTRAPSAVPQGISCATGTSCVSVGRYSDEQTGAAPFAAVRENGQWTLSPTGPFTGALPDFAGVSCPTAVWCLALRHSNSDGQLYADVRANGTWTSSKVPISVSQVGSVSAPSCPDVGACTFVLSYQSGGSHVVAVTLANGSWSSSPLPQPADSWGSVNRFRLSCPVVGWCEAVGAYFGGQNPELSETLSSGKWAVGDVPEITGVGAASLNSLSCTAIGECTAVGYVDGHAAVAVLSGGKWSAQELAQSGTAYDEKLLSVSCVAPKSCVAVGTHTNSARTVQSALTGALDGTSWSATVVANPSRVRSATLTDVSCVAGSSCWAVGNAVETDGGLHPIALSRQAPPTTRHALSIARGGSRTGSVHGVGITCPQTCRATYVSGSQVTLTASPSAGSVFAGWSGGGCRGTARCTVTMSTDRSVTATFKSRSALTSGAARTIDHGTSVRMTTKLTNVSNGRAIPHATVSLWRRASSTAAWSRVASMTTSTAGVASRSVTPHASGQYQWRYGGGPTILAARSPMQLITVRAR